jgi:ribose 5-phosphate isomerase RpiB
MKIAIARDHAGFALKEQLRQLAADGHVIVRGTQEIAS